MQIDLDLLEVRELASITELRAIQQLDEIVWNEHPIPLHQIITSIQNGGLVLGAYADGILVGFSYSFAGFKDGVSYLCSHMLGVHPDYQAKGIGAKLKQAQKLKAREMGYSLITWTYDPLESRNAFLNLTKLHTICNTYVENCYGLMNDDLNNGLPSDRFKVEWWINSPHVDKSAEIEIQDQLPHFQFEITEKGHPKLKNVSNSINSIITDPTSEQILVPIPCYFQQLKKDDFDLAVDWRLNIRKIFQTLFNNGFAAIALKRDNENFVNHYVLVKREKIQLS